MEEYYECNLYGYQTIQSKLLYKPLFGEQQKIPIILVNDNGSVFEFFTKTRFELMSTGAASGFKLPNSTLSYHFDSSCLYWCRKILPADALKELEPFMKKPARYAKQINSFFDWFRDDLIRMEQEAERKSQENSDAQTVLSDYWRNH